MKILFACGGTAGHVNPALALAGLLRQRHPDCEILFVGADGGMEERLVKQAGYPIETVTITSFRRSFSPKAVAHNFGTLRNLNLAKQQSEAILDKFQPDLAMGTGGYASYSIIHTAARRGIPTLIHESNAIPGLTTKQLSKVADKVLVGFAASRSHYDKNVTVIPTGTPVRGEFFALDRSEARRRIGAQPNQPVLLSYFGSLGAEVMNRRMTDFLLAEKRNGAPWRHVHGTGRNDEAVRSALAAQQLDLDDYPALTLHEYIYDMPLYMAAADVVICRAGASTISELTALGKPAILIPSPNVTANHQEKNACILADAGAAILLTEDEADSKTLYDTAARLLNDEARRREMTAALLSLQTETPAETIYQIIRNMIKL